MSNYFNGYLSSTKNKNSWWQREQFFGTLQYFSLFSNLFYCQEKFTRYFCAAFIPFGRILWLKWNLRETNIRVLAWVHILEKINKNFIVFKSFFNTKMISLLGSYLRYLFWINFNFPFCSFWQGRYLPERLFRLERSHYSASLS